MRLKMRDLQKEKDQMAIETNSIKRERMKMVDNHLEMQKKVEKVKDRLKVI